MISKTTQLAVLCALLLPAAASAQIVDVQSRFSGKAKPGLHGSLEGAVDWRTGNTEYFVVRGTASATWLTGRHLVLALALAERSTALGEVTLSHAFEHLRYRFRWTGLLRPEAFVQHEIDYFRRLQLRVLVGAGMRFSIFDDEDRALAFGVAVMMEHERLRRDGLPDAGDSYTDPRLSTYAMGRATIWENVDLVETVYAQPRLDRPSDLKLLNETGLSLKVNDHLAAKVAFNLTWDTAPPDGVKPLDTQVKTSLMLSW